MSFLDDTIPQWHSGHTAGYKAAWKYHDENAHRIPSRETKRPVGPPRNWVDGYVQGWWDAALDIEDRYRDGEEEEEEQC